jgi:hypothetical protein
MAVVTRKLKPALKDDTHDVKSLYYRRERKPNLLSRSRPMER